VRRAAFAALLAAPVPVWAAPAASAAPAGSAAAERSCSLPGHPQPWDRDRRVEGLIGNLSPGAGSSVAPGTTISFLIADEKPFPTPLSGDAVVTVNGASVTATAGAQENGVPITYANPRDKGSRSTRYEVPFSFTLPADITGSAHIQATAHDGDGNKETVCWTLTVPETSLPSGAIGGIGVAAVGGVVLMVVQLRRRRGATPIEG
jgi:hypothetical protein